MIDLSRDTESYLLIKMKTIVQTRGGHISEKGQKRNETSVIGREERKKDGIWYMYFSQVAKVCLFFIM